MIIGVLVLDIFLPFARSLKDKRQILKGFTDRVRSRHNVSLAELDFQDKWQRARIGVAALNSRKKIVEGILSRIFAEAEAVPDAQVIGHSLEFF